MEFEGLVVLAFDLEFGLEFFDQEFEARDFGTEFVNVRSGCCWAMSVRTRFVAVEAEALARCFVARKLRPGREARRSRLACFRRARVEELKRELVEGGAAKMDAGRDGVAGGCEKAVQ